MPGTYRVGLLGHGTVGSAFETLLAERADAIAAVTGLRPEVTGAYGHALANNYNGVPRPPVILCAGGEARVAVRRETLEDLVARDV